LSLRYPVLYWTRSLGTQLRG